MAKAHNGDQKNLLYSPKTWVFWAILLSPIVPAIFYYSNSKILGYPDKGRKILMGIILLMLPLIILSYFGSLILLLEVIIGIFVARKLAKDQLPAYEKMKKERGLEGGRSENKVLLASVAVLFILAFLIPLALNFFLKLDRRSNNGLIRPLNGQHLPQPEANSDQSKIKKFQGDIKLTLPAGYQLIDKKTDEAIGTYSYKIASSSSTEHWSVIVVPLEAMKKYDQTCPPGDCMRDALIYPSADFHLKDWVNFQKDQPPTVNILNGQKYYSFTTPVDGDEGYFRRHITYVRGTRIIFTSPWAENAVQAEKSDDFMKTLKIITLN